MIDVIECGKLNSVQDLGRTGMRAIGIGTSGGMDNLALRTANLLVGNDEAAAIIEIQTFPFAVRFDRDVRFALTGADVPARLDDLPLPPWWSMVAKAGQVLRIGPPKAGARAYLALSGGIDVPITMGSRSTNLRNGFGGFEGRALEIGDRLQASQSKFAEGEFGANVPPSLVAHTREISVRVVGGAELSVLPSALQEAFWTSDWSITMQSDRGGYRLRGPELRLPKPMEMRSYGVTAGIIQLPPSGQPIVQLSDANTAGGYPRLGGVIEADMHRLGQSPPGTKVRFVETDFRDAQAAQQQIDDYLATLAVAVRQRLRPAHIHEEKKP